LPRGWYGERERHRRAALKGWLNRNRNLRKYNPKKIRRRTPTTPRKFKTRTKKKKASLKSEILDSQTLNEIENNADKKFIYVEFANGHQHTLKAFDVWNEGYGNSSNAVQNQLNYLEYVAKKEHTWVIDVKATNSEKEAYEEEMIDEDGGFL